MILIIMLIGLIPAYIASNKGRSFFLWWLWGMAMFIIALPHSILIKDLRETKEVSVVSEEEETKVSDPTLVHIFGALVFGAGAVYLAILLSQQ